MTKHQHAILFAVAAISVIVGLAAAIAFVLRDDTAPATTTAPTTASTTTTTEAPELVGEVPIGAGITAIVPSGALSAGADLTATTTTLDLDIGAAIEPIGPTVEVDLDGTQHRAIRLRFPYTAPEDPDGILDDPGALTFALHQDGTTWGTVPVTTDADEGTATLTAESLSPFGIFSWSSQAVGRIVEGIVEEITGGLYTNVDEPSCSGPDAAAQVTVTSPDTPLMWCTERDPDGTVTVKVANKRRYAVSIGWSSAFTPDRDETGGLAERVSEALPGDMWVLPPGAAATFTAPAGTTGTIEATYDGVANSLTSLMTGVQILSAIIGAAPFVRAANPSAIENALALASCLADILDGSVDSGTFVNLFTFCFDADFLTPLTGAVGAAIVAPVVAVLGTAAYFVGSFQAGIDLITGGSETTFTVDTNPEAPSGDGDGGSGDGSGWPTDDNEGPIAYFAWLGAAIFFPSWSSCSSTHCIAGNGSEVLVTSLSPLRDLGTVPQSQDPTAALASVGLTGPRAAAALRPG